MSRKVQLQFVIAFVANVIWLAPSQATMTAGPSELKQPDLANSTVVFVSGQIKSSEQLPTAALRAARKKFVSGQFVSLKTLVRLADAGDSLAAFEVARRLGSRSTTQEKLDAIHYYARAAFRGRQYAVSPMMKLIDEVGAPNLDQRRLRSIEDALASSANAGHQYSLDTLVELYSSGEIFGHQPDKANDLLKRRALAGQSTAAVDLAIRLMSKEPLDDAALSDIDTLLIPASASSDISVKAMALNLRKIIAQKRPMQASESRP